MYSCMYTPVGLCTYVYSVHVCVHQPATRGGAGLACGLQDPGREAGPARWEKYWRDSEEAGQLDGL